MKSFNTFAGFSAHLAAVGSQIIKEEESGLREAARIIEEAAKDKIGQYQGAAGPFAAWAPLAEATKKQRESLGYPADEPLLRDGTLRDSIQSKVEYPNAYIGSDSDIAVYQELGTKDIPPRSFLGAAAAEKAVSVMQVLGNHVYAALTSAGQRQEILKP